MGGWVGWSKEIVSPQSGSAEHSLESKFRLSVAKKCSLLYILIACFGSVGLPLIVGGWGGRFSNCGKRKMAHYLPLIIQTQGGTRGGCFL